MIKEIKNQYFSFDSKLNERRDVYILLTIVYLALTTYLLNNGKKKEGGKKKRKRGRELEKEQETINRCIIDRSS